MQQPFSLSGQQPVPGGNSGINNGINNGINSGSNNGINSNINNISRKISMEEMLGKNIMGIAASILIFISFILFAILMVPSLTDVIKVVLMFAVSGGITGFSLFMWLKKSRKSAFFLSLLACGVGALYISLFMCNAYFHIINEILLYVLILAWAAGVLWLSTYKQRLFEIIGEVGILVSIIAGCLMCLDSSDAEMLMILTIYSCVGVAAFLIFRIKDNVSLMIHGGVGAAGLGLILICETVFIDRINNMPDGGYISGNLTSSAVYIALIIIAVVTLAVAVLYMLKVNKVNAGYLPIISIVYSVLMYFAITLMIDDEDISWLVILILSIVIYVLLECCKKKLYVERQVDKSANSTLLVWQALLAIIMCTSILSMEDISEYIGLSLIAIPLLLYGFWSGEDFHKTLGLIAYGLLTIIFGVNIYSYTILTFICFLIVCIAMLVRKNEYSITYKCIAYGLFMIRNIIVIILFINEYDGTYDLASLLIIWILGLLNLAALVTPFGRSWLTYDDEKPFKIVTYVINACLMFYSLITLFTIEDEIMHFMVVLGAIGLFCINSVNILKKKYTGLSVYVGIKLTILILAILGSYDAANYVMSISAFLIAIAFIIVGFVMDIKSLRIYGLVVSLICVVKLVMIDITYENTAGHALSFFISGVLCFVISAVYSLAEKRLMKQK